MAQQIIDLGTPGNSSTGDFVYDAFSKAQANFNDLYTNYMPKTGGTFSGNISFAPGANINNLESITLWDQVAQNNQATIQFGSDDLFALSPSGTSNTLNYIFSNDKWYINNNEILVAGTTAASIGFSSYLSITSANVQAAIAELKDEVDALALSSGSGDMLKSTYDIANNGIVDNSEALNGQAGSYYLSRTNHTGTQLASTISDFDTAVSANADVTANTAKVTNATHTGEVTGSTVLTLDATSISNRTLATMVAGDLITFLDATDGLLKKGNVQDLITGSLTVDTVITDGSTNPVTNNAIRDALVNINAWVATNNIEANKIIDGSGSGLDADTVDGIHGTALAQLSGAAFTGDITVDDKVTVLGFTSAADATIFQALPSDYATGKPYFEIKKSAVANSWVLGLWDGTSRAGTIDIGATNVTALGNTIWHAGNADSTPTNGNTTVGVTSDGVYDALVGINSYIPTGALNGSKISDFTIGANKIQNNSLGADKLAPNSVGTDEMQDNAILPEHINIISGTETAGKALTYVNTSGFGYETFGAYVDGGFTATLVGASSGNYTIGAQASTYAKVGKMVFFQCTLANISGTAPTGILELRGLPYAPNYNTQVSASFGGVTTPSFYYTCGWVVQNGAEGKIQFYMQSNLDGNNQETMSNVDFSGSGSIIVAGCYRTV